MKRHLAVAIVVMLAVPLLVAARPSTNALEQRIIALEARVTALEALAWPSPAPTATSTPTTSPTSSPSAPGTPTPSPAPPTPVPSASTAPSTPSPSSSPPTAPTDPPFGTRPSSGALAYTGNCPAVIENLTFRDISGIAAIRLVDCANVVVRDVDFINVAGGVVAIGSTNITVVRARYQNITGPAQPRTGANVANFVQFDRVTGGRIADNRGRCGDTEDIVSVHNSSNVTVEDNHFEGGLSSTPGCLAWSSSSSSGIALGDSGGSGNIARRNILLNPGQVGAFISGGTNHQIADNIVIGQQRPSSNVGLYVWNQSSSSCSGHAVTGNRIRWYRADGVSNTFWNAGNCGSVDTSGNIHNDTTLDPNAYRVAL